MDFFETKSRKRILEANAATSDNNIKQLLLTKPLRKCLEAGLPHCLLPVRQKWHQLTSMQPE